MNPTNYLNGKDIKVRIELDTKGNVNYLFDFILDDYIITLNTEQIIDLIGNKPDNIKKSYNIFSGFNKNNFINDFEFKDKNIDIITINIYDIVNNKIHYIMNKNISFTLINKIYNNVITH